MKTSRLVLTVVCLFLFFSVGLALTLRSRFQPSPRADLAIDIPRTPTELIAGYRNWTRVNPTPALVVAQNSQLCAAPTATAAPGSPHGPDKYITVYVNEIGRHAMMEEKTPHFPQGSVVIKEKLTTATSTDPELLTVMIKREAGYNPDSGDWEYMVFDGSGKTVQARSKLENCQACHKMDEETDYISRSYLPVTLRAKLK